MWSRNEISKTFVIVVLGISFMHSIWRDETRAGETQFALIVRGEEGRETRLSLSEIGKLPRCVHEGNLRIVVPHEKRHARWIRQIVTLSIRRS